jgi:dUTPase
MLKVLTDGCKPTRGSKYSAYVDLYASEDVIIGAGETKIVGLGVKLDLEKLLNNVGYTERTPTLKDRFLNSHYLEVALRSSLAVKGLIIPNGIGIIDLDYSGEIGLIVHNPLTPTQIALALEAYNNNLDEIQIKALEKSHNISRFYEISKGDKIAQCTLKEHKGSLMGYESDTIREGGYGSTDKDKR